jgi:alpha/beta superfamily hydrolase
MLLFAAMSSGHATEKQDWTEERRFFESDGRPLYAVMHRGKRRGAPIVIFCSSFAENHWEGRTAAISAQIIAARGYSALVYHSRAHGDSAGDLEDVTFEGLVEDAVNAATYARDRSGATEIVWVGIRFGALVGAHAIRRIAGSTGLALWEPVISARDYFLKSMRHVIYYEMSQGDRPSLTVDQMCERLKREGKIALLGYDLYRKFFESAERVELLDALQPWRGPTLIAQFQKHSRLSRENNQLREALLERGLGVRAALHRGPDGADPWWTPEIIAQQTGDWLDELA